jgi:hypothetical protein
MHNQIVRAGIFYRKIIVIGVHDHINAFRVDTGFVEAKA